MKTLRTGPRASRSGLGGFSHLLRLLHLLSWAAQARLFSPQKAAFGGRSREGRRGLKGRLHFFFSHVELRSEGIGFTASVTTGEEGTGRAETGAT